MPTGSLAPLRRVLVRTGAFLRGPMITSADYAALEARLTALEHAVFGPDAQATASTTAPTAPAPEPSAPAAAAATTQPPVRYDQIVVALPGVHYAALMTLEGEERVATFPMLRGSRGACQARVTRAAERDLMPDAVLNARLDAEAGRALEDWLTRCLQRDELPPRPAPVFAGAPVYRAIPVLSPQVAAALQRCWEADANRHRPATALRSPPAPRDEWWAEDRDGLHFTARLELVGDEILISFPGLPDCEAGARHDADVDVVAREALETWIAAARVRGEVPPHPVELVGGQIVHRAVPVGPALAAALETHWRAADDARRIA